MRNSVESSIQSKCINLELMEGKPDLDVDFPEYKYGVLVPHRSYARSCMILPCSILISNAKHAWAAQDYRTTYWCASRAARMSDTSHQGNAMRALARKALNQGELVVIDEYNGDIHHARLELLRLGAIRSLIMRTREEVQLYGGHVPKVKPTIWDLTVKEIKEAHKQLLNTDTNCRNYFKQYWPREHKELFHESR